MSCLYDWPAGNNTFKLYVTITETDADGTVTVVNSIGPGTLTVYETDEATEVGGVAWPVSLTYVAGSAGKYLATIPEAAENAAGTFYRGNILIDDGALRAADEWIDLRGVKREA